MVPWLYTLTCVITPGVCIYADVCYHPVVCIVFYCPLYQWAVLCSMLHVRKGDAGVVGSHLSGRAVLRKKKRKRGDDIDATALGTSDAPLPPISPGAHPLPEGGLPPSSSVPPLAPGAYAAAMGCHILPCALLFHLCGHVRSLCPFVLLCPSFPVCWLKLSCAVDSMNLQ